MAVSVATIYVNDEKVLKIIDTSSSPQIAGVHISANENTITATFTGVGGSTSGFNCILDCEIYNTNYTYTKVSNFELVITSPVLLEPFEGDAVVGNNSTINLVYNPYNITTSKPKIVIHCEGKAMANDLVITNEIYMGEFEEIFNGYTLTLEKSTHSSAKTDATNIANIKYSINDGEEQTLTLPLTLSGVTKISFSCDFSYGLLAGTTATGTDLISDYAIGITTYSQDLTEDTTIYIGLYTGPFIS